MIKSILSFAFLAITLVSCSSEEVSLGEEQQEVLISKSAAMRASFEEIKKQESEKKPKGSVKNFNSELCFQFVYPIRLSYNTEETVEVENYQALLEILFSETLEKHVNGIGFPFDINLRATGTVKTIQEETEFNAVIEECGYDTVDYVEVVQIASQCFTINYPVSLQINGSEENFDSEEEAQNYFSSNFSVIKSITINYPLTLTLVSSDQQLDIMDDYELIYLIDETCGFN